jgi:putative flippase GtrA
MSIAHTFTCFARYLVTGGTAALVDLAIFLLLVPVLGSVAVAATISTAIAIVVNYTLSRRFTFRVEGSRGRAGLFVLGACVGLVINATTTTQIAALDVAPAAFAKLCGTGLAFVFNFLFNHFVVFWDSSPSKQ